MRKLARLMESEEGETAWLICPPGVPSPVMENVSRIPYATHEADALPVEREMAVARVKGRFTTWL